MPSILEEHKNQLIARRDELLSIVAEMRERLASTKAIRPPSDHDILTLMGQRLQAICNTLDSEIRSMEARLNMADPAAITTEPVANWDQPGPATGVSETVPTKQTVGTAQQRAALLDSHIDTQRTAPGDARAPTQINTRAETRAGDPDKSATP